MKAGLVREVGDRRGVHVGHTPKRVLGVDVATALRAPLTLARRLLAEAANVFGAARDAHRVGLPQRKGVHRTRRPAAARLAMAIAHGGRLAAHRELHTAAETTAFVCAHAADPLSWRDVLVCRPAASAYWPKRRAS